jgi:hypothetical protein
MSSDDDLDSTTIQSASQTYAATVAKLKKTDLYQKVLREIADAVENQLTEVQIFDRLPALLIIHLRRLGYYVDHDDITVISWLEAN